MSGLHDLAARCLRTLDPELGHTLAVAGLSMGLGPRAPADGFPRLRTACAGLDLPNPLGLAAGFDKDARAPDALLAAGFGFVECGTVTPRAQPGNPRPRLFRLAPDRAVINRMGFNNEGVAAFAARLARRSGRGGVVGANLGANKDSADRVADYVAGLNSVWNFASYVVINISSPNTPGLRDLQARAALEDLLGAVDETRAALVAAHGARPLMLKAAPDLDEAAVRDICEAALAHRIDALIVSNTTVARTAQLSSRRRGEAGGLSGRPLFAPSTQLLREFARALAGRVALIGCGGVDSGQTALAKLKAGACAVQLYSAMVYEGPGLVRRILRDLDARLAAEGFASAADAVAVDLP